MEELLAPSCRTQQAPRRGGAARRRFLWLSLCAWGLPALMTTACALLFRHGSAIRTTTFQRGREAIHVEDRPPFSPTLVETRLCFDEVTVLPERRYGVKRIFDNFNYVSFWYIPSVQKLGSALWYYVPAFALIVTNLICVGVTMRKVSFLRRGNSVLRRGADEARGQGPSAAAADDAQAAEPPSSSASSRIDAKSMKVYIKMLLMAGAIEMITEMTMWVLSTASLEESKRYLSPKELSAAFRATGLCTDLFRAACVAWLCAPQGGYVAALRRRLPRRSGSWRWRGALSTLTKHRSTNRSH